MTAIPDAQSDGTRLLVAAVVLTLLTKFLMSAKRAFLTELCLIPGPWYAPWTNLWLKYQVLAKKRTAYIHSLHECYGDFVRISPTEISVAHLDSFKTIHHIGTPFNRSRWYRDFVDTKHLGLFGQIDPKSYAERRRLFANSFSNSFILNFEPVVRQHLEAAIAKIKRDARRGEVNIYKWFSFMCADNIGEYVFGESFHMLDEEHKNPFIEDLETCAKILGMKSEIEPLLALANMLPIPRLRHVLAARDRVVEYGQAAMKKQRQDVTTYDSAGPTSLFTNFLNSDKHPKLSFLELAQQAGRLVMSGNATIANSLTYLIWVLLQAKNQVIVQRLTEELKPMSLYCNSAELAPLPYLKNVIEEGLRLYGAIQGSLPRTTPREGVIFGGKYKIPGGTVVSTQAYTIHRNAKIFPDPETFNPDRWQTPTVEMATAFHPFGVGVRSCPGVHIAMMELRLGVFLFFKQCSGAVLSSSTTEETMTIEHGYIMGPKHKKCMITVPEAETRTNYMAQGIKTHLTDW